VFLTNGAELVVARRDAAKFVEERRYDIAESETWPMPAVLADGLVVRDATGIARLKWM
jgi:hypothetical protein